MATKTGKYVDGFVFVVPKKNFAEYRKMAQWGRKIWLKCGALDYKECIGDDMKQKGMGGMKHLLFPNIAKAKHNEDVWFSFIVYKSKKHRDEVNVKVMKDPSMNDSTWKDKPMPFDMKRMACGGFKVVVDK